LEESYLFKEYFKVSHIFNIDVDLSIEKDIDESILGKITAVLHPGYINKKGPFETNPESSAFVPEEENYLYFAGGLTGGQTVPYLNLCNRIVNLIDNDTFFGYLATWHDESYLNRALKDTPPSVILSPYFLYPETDDHYPQLKNYSPYIMALDKDHDFYRQK
jgi:hypothetical protein